MTNTQTPVRFYLPFCNMSALSPTSQASKSEAESCHTMYFQVVALGSGLQMVLLNPATAVHMSKTSERWKEEEG